ncbi:hypothetical protein JRQ81_014457 [Phrynocephalus forsythii]|uniref:ribonuclease H n=1 Tax=Phrynocephalus forsythii TaxID=171643 RepID=A0A9Q0Y009_9SAUR|nr:hypothetical protein JRQ81_014457 [Phrynocephalus forsythii]
MYFPGHEISRPLLKILHCSKKGQKSSSYPGPTTFKSIHTPYKVHNGSGSSLSKNLRICIFPYLDDWLVVSPSKEKGQKDIHFFLYTLDTLGLQINVEKSHLCTVQRLTYIGAVLDSSLAPAFPPSHRLEDIASLVPLLQPYQKFTSPSCSEAARTDSIHYFGG